MNIGEAAAASGVSAKMVRHYESIGLLRPPTRTAAGYRQYSESDTRTLKFIRQARDAGFGLEDIRQLVSLWQDASRSAREVKRLVEVHRSDIADRIRELQSIADALSHLLAHCHGDDRPDCPILEAFGSDTPTAAAGGRPVSRAVNKRRVAR